MKEDAMKKRIGLGLLAAAALCAGCGSADGVPGGSNGATGGADAGVGGAANVGAGGDGSGGDAMGGAGGQMPTICTPNATKSCYSGPATTKDVGLCVGGITTCSEDGSAWGECDGEVVPVTPSCALPLVDDNCDGDPNGGCCATGTWTVSTVDSNGNAGARVFVDATGTVHMLYPNNDASEVRYAWRPRGGSWSYETGNTSKAAGFGATFDANGGPHAVYSHYAKRAGPNIWTEEPGSPKGALAISSTGTLVVASSLAALSPNTLVGHVRQGPSNWLSKTLEPAQGWVGGVALVASPDGSVQLTYGHKSSKFSNMMSIRETALVNGAWMPITTIPGVATPGSMAMTVDASGVKWTVWKDSEVPGFMRVKGGGQTQIYVFPYELRVAGPYAAVRHAGETYVAMRTKAGGGLKLTKLGSPLKHETIPIGKSIGGYTSVAVDSVGGIHVVTASNSPPPPEVIHAYRCP
jgi:hypothetical protein